jgi:FixJ family two-component response regulator
VHVVEDDERVRTALLRLLSAAGLTAHGYASAAEFLLADRDSRTPSCILLDLALPGLSGVELHDALNHAGSPLPIIYLSGCADVATSVRAMKAGAVDFLTKPVDRQALFASLDVALERDRRRLSQARETRDLHARYERLTPRERQVLRLVTSGKLNKQIADALGTSVRTVKAHRAQVMRKMEVGSLAALVIAAAQVAAGGNDRVRTG